jgi:hypothetical protein
MDSNDKTAAAILAVEASRQQQTLLRGAIPKGRDISGELLELYRYFLNAIEEKKPV